MKGYEKKIRRKVDLARILKTQLEEETPELIDQRKRDIAEYKEILKGYTHFKIME